VEPLLPASFGSPYLYADEVTSTQDVLRDGRHPQGAVAVAEHQTAGRGRSGRRWEDTPSRALLCSVLLRPPPGAPLPQLSLVVGLAVAEAIEDATRLATVIRWPNDVLVGEKKVAGILLEASGEEVACGIGVNVNQEPGEMPAETRTPATSLRLATGRVLDRGALLAGLLRELDRRYAQWLEAGLAALVPELERRNSMRGRPVVVEGRSGIAGRIAPDGRLTATIDGEAVLIESGEVEARETG
jgi:BirA family biotin operon repressor/biotin-[acetyl-CoA-carboxylase] ligase